MDWWSNALINVWLRVEHIYKVGLLRIIEKYVGKDTDAAKSDLDKLSVATECQKLRH
jgi:hypothetical protein